MYRRRSDIAKHFAPRQTPGRRGSTDQQTAAQRVLFHEVQADTICWELFLSRSNLRRRDRLYQFSHPRRHESGKVWDTNWADYSESVLPARDRSLRIRSAAALGLCLPCLARLPCPPCLALPAFRHSVNLLCCWCHALHCDCNTPASNMSTVLAPFGPNSVGTSRRASSLADKGPGAESAESASQGQATSSPSQSGLPSSIDTTKLCPFEAAALAFQCRCCVISLPCSEAPCWAMLDACWHWQTPLPSSSPQLRRSGRDAPGAR